MQNTGDWIPDTLEDLIMFSSLNSLDELKVTLEQCRSAFQRDIANIEKRRMNPLHPSELLYV